VLLHFAAVSSRAEEKQRRREEREAKERAERAGAARRKRIQIALAGVAGLAAIAVVVLLISGTLGGDGDAANGASTPASDVTLPEPAIGDMKAAAAAAGCKLANPAIEGAQHEDRVFTESDYKTNPPTSGNHSPPPAADDGVYEATSTPPLGGLVHSLEHGRIDVQYKAGTPAETVSQLEALLAEQNEGYHMLLFENTTKMDAQVAATAWGHSLTCPTMNDKVFDAIRTFRAQYIDKGPENVP
jgi:Protein of unknown function (DUF3105)